MADYTIIDAHVHTYQTREIGLQAKQGSNVTDYGGTLDELLPLMEKANISKAVMVNMLPIAEMRDAALAKLTSDFSQPEKEGYIKEIDSRMLDRLARRNSWTCGMAKENPSLVPFINLDPLMGEGTMTDEILDKVNNQGAKGIKLHPNIQRFFPNDRRLWPVYQTAQQLGLPVISHSGSFETPIQYAQPNNFKEILDSFPNLTLVMAHVGKGFFDEATSLAKAYPNLQFDCSGIISSTEDEEGLSDANFTALIRKVGVERVMFGSDYPWHDPAIAIERL
ncbi:amidohydrolase family protein, partial [Chloroflexota bacterium]